MIPKTSWTRSDISDKGKWIAAAVFAFCVASTFISYKPYRFAWDDAEYLVRSIMVSQALWHGQLHGLYLGMVSVRPPMMTLMGVPWGPLASWDAAGKCFLTLATAISILAAFCLYLLLRVGIRPLFLGAASVCVFAAMGPYLSRPSANGFDPPGPAASHFYATGFLADSLLAWICLSAALLVPYEARTHRTSTKGALLRGLLWGCIFSLGALTKLDFFYFVILLVPVLFFLRVHNSGLRNFCVTLATFVCSVVPAAFYLGRWGRLAFWQARASSFGHLSHFYNVPLSQFIGETARESPGLVAVLVLIFCALVYRVILRRSISEWVDWLSLLITIGFGLIVLVSDNKEIRFAFPAIVTAPFLTGILFSGKGQPSSARPAALAACLVFCGLFLASLPVRHRLGRKSLERADAVLAQAARCNARSIVLATDSPTLNIFLMDLAMEVSPSRPSRKISTLAYGFSSGEPIDADFQQISKQDLVVFQDKGALNPPFTNVRVPEYEQYVGKNGYTPVRVGNDVIAYSKRCGL